MGYTTPTTLPGGYFVTPTEWNTDLVDNIIFLANPPSCRVYHASTQSVADSTDTALVFNTERFDTTGSMHDTSSNTGRITIGTAGLYEVFAHIQLAAAADYSQLYGYFRVNGGTAFIGVLGMIGTLADNTAGPFLTGSTVWKFAANDYVEVVVHQDNSANAARNVTAGTATDARFADFGASWVGLG